jgi:hypothetical protein
MMMFSGAFEPEHCLFYVPLHAEALIVAVTHQILRMYVAIRAALSRYGKALR